MHTSPSAQSSQIDYQLHTLGWASFQDLCTTVAELIFGFPVKSYSKIKDRGRDSYFYEQPTEGQQNLVYTIQSKHFSNAQRSFRLSDLDGERAKIRQLVSEGNAHGYIVMTNAIVSVAEAERIEAALRQDGVNHPTIVGKDWITRKIHESPKIRAMVPRLYGLGDLSWILDERAIAQAIEVIGSLGGDMQCYVRTNSHLKAVKALAEHKFVLLIGEPAAGKSTIAANLAMSAIDLESCNVIRVTGPGDIVTHWNPHEKNRFFWVDDAFGATQLRRDAIDTWNKVLPTMAAALRSGNRFVLTSRDYIWRRAQSELKTSSFKPLIDGKVVIYAEDLSLAERERILYNHIKFGDQPKSFKKSVKKLLPSVASNRNFKPEIARRLGSRFFTKELIVSPPGITEFVERPRAFLEEVLRQLDASARAAIALVFLNGSRLLSPIQADQAVNTVEDLLGVKLAEVREAFESLEGTIFSHLSEQGQTYWTFKHPTIADAYGAIVAGNPELIEIYLKGAKLNSILYEVVCTGRTVAGATVEVPKSLYNVLSLRMQNEASIPVARDFLLKRSNSAFRSFHLAKDKERLLTLPNYLNNPLSRDPQLLFFMRLHRDGNLPTDVHEALVDRIERELVSFADAEFLEDKEVCNFLGEEALNRVMQRAKIDLLPELETLIESRVDEYDTDDDPDDYLDDLENSIRTLERLFKDSDSIKSIISAKVLIDEKKDEIKDQFNEAHPYEPDDDDRQGWTSSKVEESLGGSVFDDIDE